MNGVYPEPSIGNPNVSYNWNVLMVACWTMNIRLFNCCMPVALANGIVTNLVALMACPSNKPWAGMVTTIGKAFVMAVGIN